MQIGNNFLPSYNPDWDDPVFAQEGDVSPNRAPIEQPPQAAQPTLAAPVPPTLDLPDAWIPVFDLEEPEGPRAGSEQPSASDSAGATGAIDAQRENDPPEAATTGGPVAWPPRRFGVPALLCRSSIFSAGPGKKGQQNRAARAVACNAPYSATLEGPRLTMADKAVWEQVAQAAWKHGYAGERFPISLGAIHKAITGSRSSPSSEELDRVIERLRRLSSARVSFARGQLSGSANLIAELVHVKDRTMKRGRWLAAMDAGWVPLFAEDTLCAPLAASNRARTELGKWLRDFFASNKAYRHSAKRLREFSGFEGTQDKFAAALRAGLGDIASSCPTLLVKCDLDDSAAKSSDWTVDVAPSAAAQVKASPADGKKKTLAAVADAKSEVGAAPSPSQGPGRRKGHAPPKRRGGVAL